MEAILEESTEKLSLSLQQQQEENNGDSNRVLRQVTLKTVNHLSIEGTPQPQWIIETGTAYADF